MMYVMVSCYSDLANALEALYIKSWLKKYAPDSDAYQTSLAKFTHWLIKYIKRWRSNLFAKIFIIKINKTTNIL